MNIDCERIKELLYLYADKQIEEQAEVQGHILRCASCQALKEDIDWLIKLLNEIPKEEAPPNLTDCVMGRLRHIKHLQRKSLFIDTFFRIFYILRYIGYGVSRIRFI